MRYFDYIDEENLNRIFFKRPCEFNKDTDKDMLKYALGAFLYVPATQYNMIYKSIIGEVKGVKPLAICLEDAIGVKGENEAINNLRSIFREIRTDLRVNMDNIPLIFLRVRNVVQLNKIKDIIVENKDIIVGILIPKANSVLLEKYVETLNSMGLSSMYIITIIESEEFINIESKKEAFENLYKVLLKNKRRILSIRIGITDILGIYSIRRSKKFSIYDNLICTDFMRDTIVYLNKKELDIPISGGVSEFFYMKDEEIKSKYIEEILLDKFNGFIGKTVIHPSQIPITQALCTINYEDFIDAQNILANIDGKYGVNKSVSKDRMNEINPHLLWAKRVLTLSNIYGVLNEGIDYNELLKF